MSFKKSAVICFMVLIYPWETYADNKQHDIFLHLDAGVSLSSNLKGDYQSNMGNSAIFGAGLKYQVAPKIKIGTSFAYRPNYEYKHKLSPEGIDVNAAQKINTASFMMNVSYDILTIKDKITPYVEIGAGVSRVQQRDYTLGNITSNGKITHNFTWNGGFGVAFKVQNSVSIDASYKYNDLGKIKQFIEAGSDSEVEKGRMKANEFMLAFRFKI